MNIDNSWMVIALFSTILLLILNVSSTRGKTNYTLFRHFMQTKNIYVILRGTGTKFPSSHSGTKLGLIATFFATSGTNFVNATDFLTSILFKKINIKFAINYVISKKN